MYFNHFLPENRPLIGWLVSGGKWLEFISQFQIKSDYNFRKEMMKSYVLQFRAFAVKSFDILIFLFFLKYEKKICLLFFQHKNNCNFLKICFLGWNSCRGTNQFAAYEWYVQIYLCQGFHGSSTYPSHSLPYLSSFHSQ